MDLEIAVEHGGTMIQWGNRVKEEDILYGRIRIVTKDAQVSEIGGKWLLNPMSGHSSAIKM